MDVLILSGGKGTGLFPLTKHHPKIMSSIHGKPFLYHILKLYEKHNIIMSIGYMKEAIKNWCRENNIWLEYAEENEPLGHSGAILNAQSFLQDSKIFAVVNGDTYHNINLDSVKRGFLKNKDFIAIQVFARNILTDKSDCCGIYMFKQDCFKYFRKGIHTDEILRCIPTAKQHLQDKFYLDIGSHKGLKYAKESKLFREDK